MVHGEIEKSLLIWDTFLSSFYMLFALKRKFLLILAGNLVNQACQEAGEEL